MKQGGGESLNHARARASYPFRLECQPGNISHPITVAEIFENVQMDERGYRIIFFQV